MRPGFNTLILKVKHKVWPGNMSLVTSQKVLHVRISQQSHGHHTLGFWMNCIDWLSVTWLNHYRNLLCWSNWKMSSGTEREETRKVAAWCVVSSGQCTCLYVITSTDCHLKCRFWTAPPDRHPSYSPDLAPSDFICFQNWRNSWKDGNLLTTMLSAPRDWLEDQDEEFFYNGTRPFENRWTKCISCEGDYVQKWQNIMLIFCS